LEFQGAHEWISAGLFIATDIAQEKQNWLTGKTDSVSDVRLDSATLAPRRCPEFN